MQKNTAGKWVVFAFESDSGTNPGQPVTGDAANITANIRIDGGVANAVDDTNPTELEDGYYIFDITAVESNGDLLLITPESATANVNVIGVPGAVWTTPANFNDLGIESDGDLTQVNTCVSNTDMRGTDSALLAASAPTNFGDLAITASTGKVTVGTNDDKTGYSISGTKTTLDALNDVAATDIVSAGAITTLSGAVVNVDTVDTCTTNTDMRGTDNAFLAASAPTNFSDLAITVTTGQVTVGTNNDKTGYSISGSKTTLDALNDISTTDVNTEVDTALSDIGLDHLVSVAVTGTDITDNSIIAKMVSSSATADWDTYVNTTDSLQANRDKIDSLNDVAATDIVSAGAITTLSGAVVNVDTVDTCTTNTDMRGTDSALLASSAPTNFGDLSISSSTGYVTVGGFLGGTLTETTGGRIAGNFDTFFENADAATTQTVDDVGSGGGDATAANQTTIINHLTDVKGTSFVKDTHSLTDITADVTGINGAAMRGTDSALLAASAPTNFGDLAITATTGKVTVGTNDDKAGYSISGTITTLDALDTAQDTQHTTTQSAISSLNDPTSGDIADAVWDEVLTGATHNIATSAGKRLRQVADIGVYEGGQVWIDTVNGTAGTANYENGTVDLPSDNIADATTLANAVNITRFKIAPNSSFTLASDYTGFNFSGDGKWTLNLGGRDLNKTTIIHATISGTCTSSNEPHFENCQIGTVTLPTCEILSSRLTDTITLSSAGTYSLDHCVSGVAGTGSPVIDFGAAVGDINYSGGIRILNMGQLGTDNMSLEGNGALTIDATCVGGTIVLRGNFKVTDNSGGAVTIVKDDNSATIETLPSTADILASGDIDGYSLEETLKICMAALAGKVSGAETATITFRAADDSKDRITATVTGNGNRTAITLDTTG